MDKPFSRAKCLHQLTLKILDHHILIASDSKTFIKSVKKSFQSQYFNAENPTSPAIEFFFSLYCEKPWQFAVETPHEIHVGRLLQNNSCKYDIFKWSKTGVDFVGATSLAESSGNHHFSSIIELFSAYFQQRILSFLLARHGRLNIIHSASLYYKNKGMLLLGGSKAGKSTLAISCVLNGMHFLAEDQSILDIEKGILSPYPKEIRLRQGALEIIPEIENLITNSMVDATGEKRWMVSPDRFISGCIGSQIRLTHVFRLKGFSDSPLIVPAVKADLAMACTLSDSFVQGRGGLDLLWSWASLLNRTECADLWIGSLDETVRLMKTYLKSGSCTVTRT